MKLQDFFKRIKANMNNLTSLKNIERIFFEPCQANGALIPIRIKSLNHIKRTE